MEGERGKRGGKGGARGKWEGKRAEKGGKTGEGAENKGNGGGAGRRRDPRALFRTTAAPHEAAARIGAAAEPAERGATAS